MSTTPDPEQHKPGSDREPLDVPPAPGEDPGFGPGPYPQGGEAPMPAQGEPYPGQYGPPGGYAGQYPPPGGHPNAYQQPGQYQGSPYGNPLGTYLQGYPEQKSRLVAGLLGVLLGSLGIHRFYLGYVGIGVAQIIVTFVTFGVGAIWGFIEGVMILVGAEAFRRDAKGVPLKE